MEKGIDLVNRYKEMLREDPASEVFASLAEALYSQGQWEETTRICRRGLEIHPRHLRAQVLLGLALWESGDKENARQELETAQKRLEENAPIYRALAELAQESGDVDHARRFLTIYQNMQSEEAEEKEPPWVSIKKEEWPQEIMDTAIQPEVSLQEAEIPIEEILDTEAQELELVPGGIEESLQEVIDLAIAEETLSEETVSQTEELLDIEDLESRLLSTEEELIQEPAKSAITQEMIFQEPEGSSDPLLSFLVSWQQEYEEKGPKHPESPKIFTKEDRQRLRQLLSVRK
jgi:hypothetical protein